MQLSMFLSATKQWRCPNQQPTNNNTATMPCQLFFTNFSDFFDSFFEKFLTAFLAVLCLTSPRFIQ